MTFGRLDIESPVAVIGDRSPSMGMAIRTSTIIASLLCAIAKAELSFFSHQNYIPPDVPRTITEVKMPNNLEMGGGGGGDIPTFVKTSKTNC